MKSFKVTWSRKPFGVAGDQGESGLEADGAGGRKNHRVQQRQDVPLPGRANGPPGPHEATLQEGERCLPGSGEIPTPWGKVLANRLLSYRWLEFGSKRDVSVTYRKIAAD